jgi:hypothetical protein
MLRRHLPISMSGMLQGAPVARVHPLLSLILSLVHAVLPWSARRAACRGGRPVEAHVAALAARLRPGGLAALIRTVEAPNPRLAETPVWWTSLT